MKEEHEGRGLAFLAAATIWSAAFLGVPVGMAFGIAAAVLPPEIRSVVMGGLVSFLTWVAIFCIALMTEGTGIKRKAVVIWTIVCMAVGSAHAAVAYFLSVKAEPVNGPSNLMIEVLATLSFVYAIISYFLVSQWTRRNEQSEQVKQGK